jgi:hypothetical protein
VGLSTTTDDGTQDLRQGVSVRTRSGPPAGDERHGWCRQQQGRAAGEGAAPLSLRAQQAEWQQQASDDECRQNHLTLPSGQTHWR